jgi:hypothetical protein
VAIRRAYLARTHHADVRRTAFPEPLKCKICGQIKMIPDSKVNGPMTESFPWWGCAELWCDDPLDSFSWTGQNVFNREVKDATESTSNK